MYYEYVPIQTDIFENACDFNNYNLLENTSKGIYSTRSLKNRTLSP